MKYRCRRIAIRLESRLCAGISASSQLVVPLRLPPPEDVAAREAAQPVDAAAARVQCLDIQFHFLPWATCRRIRVGVVAAGVVVVVAVAVQVRT